MYFKNKSSKGFTLIELLVVVAIISLLSSVVFASLSKARVKARNSVRIQSVKQLINAFNLGLDSSNSFSFPNVGGSWYCISSSCYGLIFSAYSANATVDAFFTPYIKKPSDPVDSTRAPGGGYLYNSSFFGAIVISYMLEPGASCFAPNVNNATFATYVDCYYQLYP